ncbi:MAG: glycosyltransferase family 9 protein, partial [Chlamydiota bacterium]
YYPNSHVITWLARICRRIGYQSGGGSPFLTDSISWINKNTSIAVDFVELLKPLGIFANITTLKSNLSFVSNEIFHYLKKKYRLEKPYLIFHPYSGHPLKDWKDSSWRELAKKFSSHSIVFTGGSTVEKNRIDCLCQNLPNTLNLANQLSFTELKALVSNASALVAVDTMIGHLAAIYDIPSVILYAEMSDPIYWHPLSTKSLAIYQNDATATEIYKKKPLVVKDLRIVSEC